MKPKSTGDPALIKKINTAIVLEAILKHAPLSRAEISELTGLNKATVSSLVQDLIDRHLVLEIGQGKSSGGRKPVMLLFNANAGYAIGVDLGVNVVRGVLTGLSGEIAFESELQLTSSEPEIVISQLISCIDHLQEQIPSCPYGLVGIGIGVPGLVDDNGTILFAPNLGWSQVPLQQRLEEHYSVAVTIDNEANAGAQGEQKYGIGRGIAHQVYVSVGIGIGTGIILNKELYKGATGFSGELGHLPIVPNGKACRCGNEGCWELYASEHALLTQAQSLGYNLDFAGLLAAAEAGDTRIQDLFHQIGQALGSGIASIINIFNPEVIIIGNRMSRARKWIDSALTETIARRALPYHRQHVKLLFAELQDKSAVRGAAYYAISRFFTTIKGGL